MNSRHFTLGQITATFVPFGLGLIAAMMGAETALDLPYQRMIYSVWVAQALLIPALFLYWQPNRSLECRNLWLLFWTFAYVAYLAHFYYAVVVHYHGSIAEVWQQQGAKIAGSNFLDTLWWGLDVILAWAVQRDIKWIRIERMLLHIYLPLTFFVASVVIFKGFVNVLGYTMTVAILLALAVRIFTWWRAKHSPAAMGAQHA